jgi:hypothetical protein
MRRLEQDLGAGGGRASCKLQAELQSAEVDVARGDVGGEVRETGRVNHPTGPWRDWGRDVAGTRDKEEN